MIKTTLLPELQESFDKAKNACAHYKHSIVTKHDVHQPVDPAWIATKYDVSPMMFTVLKKCLRCGSSIKSKEIDLHDIISACERELELLKLNKIYLKD